MERQMADGAFTNTAGRAFQLKDEWPLQTPPQVQRRLTINTTEDCVCAQPCAPVLWSGPARSQPQASPGKGAAL
jgi:hypothetical protein